MHRIEGDNVIVEDGKNQFTETSPATIITAKIMNAIQEEICKVIEDAGISVKTADGDTFDQLSQAIGLRSTEYDYIVTNQNQLNTIIERVAANQYKIVDDYHSVYVKYVLGGYACSGGNSFLSGGDTWGYIETNDCANLVFEAGAYLGFGANPGYIEVNTDDCYLKNVSVRGSGSVGAITQSFLLNAHRVKFDHCNTNTRNSSVDFVGFQGSGTVLHNYTSSYDGCSVYTIDGSDKIYGLKDCYNLNNCSIYDLDSSGDNVYGIDTCTNINNLIISDLDTSATGAVYGCNSCAFLVNILVTDLQSATDIDVFGFYSSSSLTNCKADSLTSTGTGSSYGYYTCTELSSCKASNLTSAVTAAGFWSCTYGVTSCIAEIIDGTVAYGFGGCYDISACYADDIDSTTGNAFGFNACDRISSCTAQDIDSSGGGAAFGFYNCNYGAAIFSTEALNASNDYMDTVDANITNKVSCPSMFT